MAASSKQPALTRGSVDMRGCAHTEGCHPSLLCPLPCSKMFSFDFQMSGFGTLF